MAFIVPVVRSDYVLYNNRSSPTNTTAMNGSTVSGGGGRPRKSSFLTHKRRSKMKVMDVIGGGANCAVAATKDHAATTAAAAGNNNGNTVTFALANTPLVVSLASEANNSPKKCIREEGEPDMEIEISMVEHHGAHNGTSPTGSLNAAMDSGEVSPAGSADSPRLRVSCRNRRVSFPPMEGSCRFTRSETPGEKRVHFSFYEEIPYQEIDEEANGEEYGTPEGAEAAKVNGDKELDMDGMKDGEEESQSKEQDENIFTWSCPNRELHKATRQRASSTPSTSGPPPESPTMITNEAVAAMLKSKREAEGCSFTHHSPPSSPSSTRSRSLSDAAEAMGDKSNRFNAARKYSKGFLRLVGICSPPKNSH